MRPTLLFVWLLWMSGFLFPLQAETLSTGEAIGILTGEKEGSVNEAAGYLVETCDTATFRFIEAVLENRLYMLNGEVVTGLEKQGSVEYYRVYPSDPEPKPLLPGNSKVQEIKLSRPARNTLNKLKPFLSLSSPVKEERLTAYTQLAATGNGKAIPFLEKAAANEEDPEAKAAAEKALYTLYLLNGSEKDQKAALNWFADKKQATTRSVMEEYLKRSGISNENRENAAKTIKIVEIKERNTAVAQNIFSGLSLGSILILVALGLSIIYGLAGIINMSHGEFIMIGAYTTYCIQQIALAHLPQAWIDTFFFLSLPMAFVVTALFGLIIERLVIRHLYSRPLESLLATWGISLIMIQMARNIFGDLTSVKTPALLSGGWAVTDELIFPYNRLFIIGFTIVVFCTVYLLFQKTRLGIKIRAVTQNRNMSACVGISVKKIDAATFMIGSGLAGMAGWAITLIGNVVPNMGQTYVVDSFLVVVTGGVGKLVGCVASGMGIGVLSKFFEAGFEAVYGKVIMLIVIIIFLQYKPKGLFPDKGRVGDD